MKEVYASLISRPFPPLDLIACSTQKRSEVKNWRQEWPRNEASLGCMIKFSKESYNRDMCMLLVEWVVCVCMVGVVVWWGGSCGWVVVVSYGRGSMGSCGKEEVNSCGQVVERKKLQ